MNASRATFATVTAVVPGQHIVGLRYGTAECDHCGKSVQGIYEITEDIEAFLAGEEHVTLAIGFGCVQDFTGAPLTLAQAVQKLADADLSD